MFIQDFIDGYRKGRDAAAKAAREAQSQKLEQYCERVRMDYKIVLDRVRKSVADGVAARKHFIDIGSTATRSDIFPDESETFRIAVLEVANEEGSPVLGVSFHSWERGTWGITGIRALLTLAVGPKSCVESTKGDLHA